MAGETTLARAVLEIGADSAKFQGDTSKIKAAAKDLWASFTGMSSALDPLPAKLTGSAEAASQLVRSFQGDRIIQQAHDIASAVQQLDGNLKTMSQGQVKQSLATIEQGMALIATRGYEIPPALKQTADELRNVAKASSDLKPTGFSAFTQEVRAAIPSTQDLFKQVTTMATGFVAGTLAIEGLQRGVHLVTEFLTSSVKAFQDSEDSQRRLTTAMQAQGTASTANVAKLNALAEEYQNLTVNSDEAIRETEALLIQVGGVLPGQMDKAVAATADLASGLGVDLKSATLLVAKAFEDNFTALKKAGVQIDETRAQAEGMEYVLGQIEQRFGGQARSEAQSYAGQIKQLGNQFDDFKEKVGGAILQTGLLQEGMVVTRAVLTAFSAELQTNLTLMRVLGSVPGPIGIAFRAIGFDLQTVTEHSASFRKDVDLTVTASRSFADQLDAAKAHIAALTVEQRAQIAAALELGTSSNEIAKAFHLTTGEIDLFKKNIQDAKEAQRTAAAEAKKHADALAALAAVQLDLDPLMSAYVVHLKAMGVSEEQISQLTGIHVALIGKVIEAHDKAAAAAERHAKAELDHAGEIQKSLKELADHNLKQAEASASSMSKAIIKNYDTIRKEAAQTNDEELQLRITNIDGQIAAAKRMGASVENILALELQKENALYDQRIAKVRQQADEEEAGLDKTSAGYDQAYAAIEGRVALAMQNLSEQHRQAVDQAIEGAHKVAVSWDQALSQLSHAFADLSQISGGSFGVVAKDIGTVIAAMNLATTSVSSMKAGLSAMRGGDVKSGMTSLATGVLGAVGAMDQATASGNKWTAALSGASTGAKIGTMIMPGFGTAIGAAAGAVIGFVRHMHDGRKAVEEFANSQGGFDRLHAGLLALGDDGERLWVNLTQGVPKGDVAAAQQAIAEVAAALSKPIAQAKILLATIKAGGPDAAKAAEQLGQELKQLGLDAEKSGGLWDKSFQDLIKEAKAAGAAVDQINELISGQQDKLAAAAAGVTKGVGAQAKAYDDLQQKVADAQKAYDEAVAAGRDATEAADALTKAQTDLGHAAKENQQDFDRLSRIALNAFATLLASGMGPVEAMNKLGGSVDDLIASAKSFGLAGNDAFTALSHWRELTTTNADLLGQVAGLNDLMVASANLGGLTASSFADMQAQGLSAYNSLIAAGFTQQEAEAAEAPLLQTIIKLHTDKGLAIDENTQKLIDQAQADGVLADQEQSTNDVLKTGLSEIIKLLGGDLPEAWRKTSAAGKTAAGDIVSKDGLGKVTDALGGLKGRLDDGSDEWKIWKKNAEQAAADAAAAVNSIPTTVNIGVKYTTQDFPLPPNASSSIDHPNEETPAYAMASGWAGRVLGPTMFLAGEAGAEDVAFSGGGRSFDWSGSGNTTINIFNPTVRSEGDIIRMRNELSKMLTRDLR